MRNRRLEANPLYWYYGAGSIAFGIKAHAFNYLLLLFATHILDLPGYKAALAMAIAMLWDAVTDLFLGHWSDKTRSRLGRRHPFMYASLFILPLSFYLLFNPIDGLGETSTFLHLLLFAILIRTATTLFEVPSVAQLPELEEDYDHRNRWLALRQAFGWYGGNLIHTVNFLIWVGAYGVAQQTGYTLYSIAGAISITLAIVVSGGGTQKYFASLPQPTEPFRFRAINREILEMFESLSNPSFAALFIYGLVIGVAAGLSTALYLYNVTYFFGFSGRQIAVTGLFVFAAPLIAYAAAPFFGRLFGKRRAAIGAILINVILYPTPYVAYLIGWWPELGSWTSLYVYSLVVVVEVSCIVTSAILLDSMMADIVEDSEVDTTRRSEGLFFAARGFGNKAVSAGGIILAGTIVSLVGLDGIETVEAMTDDHRLRLAWSFLPVYCGLQLISAWVVSRYKIERSHHVENLTILRSRGGQVQEPS